MVVNSCFEDLEGRVGLKSVREFVPKARRKRNERVKVKNESRMILDFGSFTRRGLLADLEHLAEKRGNI